MFLKTQFVVGGHIKLPTPRGREEPLPSAEEHDACRWQPPLSTEQMSVSVHTLPSPWYPSHSKSRSMTNDVTNTQEDSPSENQISWTRPTRDYLSSNRKRKCIQHHTQNSIIKKKDHENQEPDFRNNVLSCFWWQN